jgi:hypothetical protein
MPQCTWQFWRNREARYQIRPEQIMKRKVGSPHLLLSPLHTVRIRPRDEISNHHQPVRGYF